jgi:periplasmic protein TonB
MSFSFKSSLLEWIGKPAGFSLSVHALIFIIFYSFSHFHSSLPSTQTLLIEVGHRSASPSARPRSSFKSGPATHKKRDTFPVQGDQKAFTPEVNSLPGEVSIPGDFSIPGGEVAAYVGEVARAIDRRKRYPRESRLRGEEGKVVLSLRIKPSGIIEESHVEISSEFNALNLAALETVRGIEQLPPIPKGHAFLRIEVPIIFRIQ